MGMKKAWICLLLALGCALLAACGGGAFRAQTDADAAAFKEAYEALNSELDENGAPKYFQLEIAADNPAVVLSYDEMREFFERGSGVLLLSRPGCPWCRKLLPTLLEFIADQETYLYCYDPEAIRAANDDDYKALVSLLDSYLDVDTVTQEEGSPDFDPMRKRLYVPHLFFLKNGEIKADLYAGGHPLLEQEDYAGMYALLREKYAQL